MRRFALFISVVSALLSFSPGRAHAGVAALGKDALKLSTVRQGAAKVSGLLASIATKSGRSAAPKVTLANVQKLLGRIGDDESLNANAKKDGLLQSIVRKAGPAPTVAKVNKVIAGAVAQIAKTAQGGMIDAQRFQSTKPGHQNVLGELVSFSEDYDGTSLSQILHPKN